MSRLPADLLSPLLAVGRRLGARHLSLFGSATRKPLPEVGDVDLHLVIPRLDRAAVATFADAAEATVRALASTDDRGWVVELRHGPFKPQPDANVLQLHLLVDDAASLELTPWVLRAQRVATGRLLLGEPLLPTMPTRGQRLREACDEINRWRDALVAREIAFRQWRFDPEPQLAEERLPVTTPWELRCLLRNAAITSDLHYRIAAISSSATDAAQPLLEQLDGAHRPWRNLADCWDQVAGRAVEILERRHDVLAQQ